MCGYGRHAQKSCIENNTEAYIYQIRISSTDIKHRNSGTKGVGPLSFFISSFFLPAVFFLVYSSGFSFSPFVKVVEYIHVFPCGV